MKKLIIFTICLLFYSVMLTDLPKNYAIAENKIDSPKLAIVIDDFGESREGVKQMLSIKEPLTCAIMPDLEYSKEDAENAHKNGHEVILHMPLESKNGLPRSWYGPRIISNNDTIEKAKETFKSCLESIPYAVGANYHIGTGVSENKKLMKAILEVIKEKNLYFLDSKTTMNSAGPGVAKELNVKFIERNLFLEGSGPNYGYTKKILNEAIDLAKTNGYAVVIGHVGPMGAGSTGKAIIDSLEEIKQAGVKIVPLSKIVEITNK